MKKLSIKKLIIIICIVMMLLLLLFFADLNKILNSKEPIFSIQKSVIDNKTEYIGLGYKFYVIRDSDSNVENIKFGTLLSSF